MTKKILKSKIMIVILIILSIFVPLTINNVKQTDKRTVAIAVGIDKEDDNYLISTQIIVPEASSTFNGNIRVYSARGENILDAIENLSVHMGKVAGFSNVSAIVFGKDMAKEGIAKTLDFFLRSKRLNDNATLITTNKKAYDLLQSVAKIDNSFSYSINALARLNQESSLGATATIESFLNDYYSGTNASLVGQIRQVQDDEEGISANNSMQSSADGSTTANASVQSEQDKNNVVSNSGYTSLFVNGKEEIVITPDQMKGFNVFLGISKRGVITLKGISDELYKNADVAVSIKNKIITEQLGYKNGIPRITYNINYTVQVEQIRQNGVNQIILDGSKDYVTKAVKEKLITEIKRYAADSINLSKQYNADVFKAQEAFYKYTKKEWNNYLSKLTDKSQAYQNIEFFLNLKISGTF